MESTRTSDPLSSRLAESLHSMVGSDGLGRLADVEPVDRRDRFLTLLQVYDLHTAPLDRLGTSVQFQGEPVVAQIKTRLESEWLVELEAVAAQAGSMEAMPDAGHVVRGMRAVAARDRLPSAYQWLAKEASREQLVQFLALEGGPDGGFDDLVAACQIGLSGPAKLELGKNYWDEMGNGDPERVHTTMHERLVAALDVPAVPREEQSAEALERAALGGLLTTNRWLQPEMIGALGLLELQAGPRCRLVLQAFDRIGVPAAAYPFYVEHAEVDPVHGKDWIDNAVVPLVQADPSWGPRILRGAWWRSCVNAAFFNGLRDALVS